MTDNDVFAVALAANKMNVKDLLELLSCKIAVKCKGKDIQGVREVFQMENDFTAQEEAAIAEEIKMAEENF